MGIFSYVATKSPLSRLFVGPVNHVPVPPKPQISETFEVRTHFAQLYDRNAAQFDNLIIDLEAVGKSWLPSSMKTRIVNDLVPKIKSTLLEATEHSYWVPASPDYEAAFFDTSANIAAVGDAAGSAVFRQNVSTPDHFRTLAHQTDEIRLLAREPIYHLADRVDPSPVTDRASLGLPRDADLMSAFRRQPNAGTINFDDSALHGDASASLPSYDQIGDFPRPETPPPSYDTLLHAGAVPDLTP